MWEAHNKTWHIYHFLFYILTNVTFGRPYRSFSNIELWANCELSVNCSLCISVYIHEHTHLCLPVYRLGAIHRALAMFPGLAATGGRPAPSSSPEDRSSSQAEAGCQHHLCLTGYIVWVKHTHRPPCFSLTVCFHIYEWYVNFDTLLRPVILTHRAVQHHQEFVVSRLLQGRRAVATVLRRPVLDGIICGPPLLWPEWETAVCLTCTFFQLLKKKMNCTATLSVTYLLTLELNIHHT